MGFDPGPVCIRVGFDFLRVRRSASWGLWCFCLYVFSNFWSLSVVLAFTKYFLSPFASRAASCDCVGAFVIEPRLLGTRVFGYGLWESVSTEYSYLDPWHIITTSYGIANYEYVL